MYQEKDESKTFNLNFFHDNIGEPGKPLGPPKPPTSVSKQQPEMGDFSDKLFNNFNVRPEIMAEPEVQLLSPMVFAASDTAIPVYAAQHFQVQI